MKLTLNALSHFGIQTQEGSLGHCTDILFDDRDWVVRYLVLDTQRWNPLSKKVLVSPISIDAVDADREEVHVGLSREQIKNSPELDEHQPVSREYEQNFFRYYGYAFYWMGEGLWGTYPHPAPLVNEEAEDSPSISSSEGHLRSFEEVKGYRVDVKDGQLGVVDKAIFDTENWKISAWVLDSRSILPGGHKYMVRPDQVDHISWVERSMHINLTKDALSERPEFDAALMEKEVDLIL